MAVAVATAATAATAAEKKPNTIAVGIATRARYHRKKVGSKHQRVSVRGGESEAL